MSRVVEGFPALQSTCCQACENDHDCTVWVFALYGTESYGMNCWLMMGESVTVHPVSNRATGFIDTDTDTGCEWFIKLFDTYGDVSSFASSFRLITT